jgi:hypothetical protein
MHSPTLSIGFFLNGNWTPPPRVDQEQAVGLEEAFTNWRQALIPAMTEEAIILLSKLSLAVRIEDKTEAAWALYLETFTEDLEDYPADIIAAVCKEWRQNNVFWPAISEFLPMCKRLYYARKNTAQRLAILIQIRDFPAPENIVTSEWLSKITKSAREQYPDLFEKII